MLLRGSSGTTKRHLRRCLHLDKKNLAQAINLERDPSKDESQEKERLLRLDEQENTYITNVFNELLTFTRTKLIQNVNSNRVTKRNDFYKDIELKQCNNPNLSYSENDCNMFQANLFCLSKKFKPNNEQMKSIECETNGECVSMDFLKKFQSLNQINDRVKLKTENRIHTDMIQPRDLNEDMRGMILDASYFKANCIDSFSLLEKKCPFTTQRGEEVLINMFTKLDLFKIYTNPKGISGTVCQIPFKGCQIVMSIILPKRNTPISTIVSEISERKVNTFRNVINETGAFRMVNVTLPKIKMKSESIEV